MSLYSDLWWYSDGTVAANARAAVFEDDANTFASIFSDSGLTVPLANPTTTDASGILTFYAADGEYWIFVGEEATGDSVLVTVGPATTGAVLSVNGQTGVVLLDAADVGAQPISTINAKGDLYAGTGNDATTRLPVGADGEVLTADSSDPTGMSWQAGGGGAVDSVNGQTGVVVLTASDVGADASGAAAAAQAAAIAASQSLSTINAKGDLYAGTANDTTTRLGVGSNGQVLTANSATTTGLEWQTPASAPVTSVNTQTGAVVLTATDVGAVPTSRTLTASTGLTGGGDLSADRSFAVSYGTTAGTATEGNDSRVTGAQQKSTLTTKGDLYVATASATTTRLPAGSDGQVLSANSAQASGLEWVAAGGGGIPATILDAKGDIIAASAADTAARLAVGTDGQYLRAASSQSTGLEYHTIVASDVGAVPTTRTITAGTGLTGGGDLSADRTINANVGTTAGTLAAGDDSRITGAQQKSTLTTKGDLYVATASATTTRQAVGTNGQIITADSSQTNGIKYAFERSFALFPRSTGYSPVGGVPYVRSSKAVTINAMYLLPFGLLADATLTSIAFEVSGAVANALARTGVYGSDATTYLPTGAAIVDNGTIDASGTGTKTVSLSQALTAGVYWLAIVGQTAAPTLRHAAGVSPFVANATFPSGSGTGWNNALVQTGVTGGLPSIGSLSDTDAPLVGIKF